jgi:hypothetical protein
VSNWLTVSALTCVSAYCVCLVVCDGKQQRDTDGGIQNADDEELCVGRSGGQRNNAHAGDRKA